MKKITMKRFEIITRDVQKEVSQIPASHNRVVKHTESRLTYNMTKKAIQKAKKEIDMQESKSYNLVVEFVENLGTKKWSDWCSRYELVKAIYKRQTKDFYVFVESGCEYKINKNRVLCIVA